jgi:serine/threonine-protein kinase
MLTGRPPFPDGTVLQKLLQHQGDAPPDPRGFRPELPLEVTQILARMLAKNPAHRYQAPGELIDDLAALGQTLGISLGGARVPRPSPRRRYSLEQWQYHLPWIVTVAALFLAVIGLDFYWSPRRSDTAGAMPVTPRTMPAAESAPLVPAPLKSPETSGELRPSGPASRTPGLDENGNAGRDPDTTSAPPAGEQPFIPPTASDVGEKAKPSEGGLDLLNKLGALLSEQAKNTSTPILRPREATPGEAVRDAPPATSAAPTSSGHVLVVSDEPGPDSYLSLHAACSAAKDGDIIELRYNGGRVPERPIEMSNVKLTIRAGQGFRPVVAFQPQQETNPFRNPPAMLSLAGGELIVSDVDWEFLLPRNVPAHWALFETRGCDLLEFNHCTLTIQGQTAYNARVAFVDIKAPPGAKSMNMDGDKGEERLVAVNLRHCVVRGEATFMRDDELQSVRLQWDNGLLATSDRLFVAGGSALQPRREARAELALRHVTAMVGVGLALLTNSEEAPHQLMTQIRCDDCVIAGGKGRPPLIEQRGSDGIDSYQARFQWRGAHNYFDGFDVYWRIMNSSGQSGSKQVDFDEWNQLWGGPAGNQITDQNSVLWAGLPNDDRPFHTHVPSDYQLADDVTNDSETGDASEHHAGFLGIELPTVSSAPRSSESRPEFPR